MKLLRLTWKRIFLIALISILLITLVFDQPIQAGASLPSVRVGLAEGQVSTELRVLNGSYNLINQAGGLVTTDLQTNDEIKAEFVNNIIRISIKKNGGDWGDVNSYSGPIRLEPTTDELNVVLVNNSAIYAKKYRGGIEVRVNSSQAGLTVINELPLEHYLYGVVPAEMISSWPLEALKAQAVAARTYIVPKLSKLNAGGFHVYPDQRSQVYGGYGRETQATNQAVDETAGKVLVDANGNIITQALYHSNSGGHTEDSENAFSNSFSYLRGKPDPYSTTAFLSNWTYLTDVDIISSKIGGTSSIIDSIQLEKLQSGRVTNVIISDLNGNTITKTGIEFGKIFNTDFYTVVNESSFMSRFFDLSTNATVNIMTGDGEIKKLHGGGRKLKVISGNKQLSDVNGLNVFYVLQGAGGEKTIQKYPTGAVTVEGHGWGHGVGMSQWGAYTMAQQGFKYDQILTFYYTGVDVR